MDTSKMLKKTKLSDYELMVLADKLGNCIAFNGWQQTVTFTNRDSAVEFAHEAIGWTVGYLPNSPDNQ